MQPQGDRAPRVDNEAEEKPLGIIQVQGYALLFLSTRAYQLCTYVVILGFCK